MNQYLQSDLEESPAASMITECPVQKLALDFYSV
jgi:heterodisulfide reductase subunit B